MTQTSLLLFGIFCMALGWIMNNQWKETTKEFKRDEQRKQKERFMYEQKKLMDERKTLIEEEPKSNIDFEYEMLLRYHQ